MCTEPVSYPLRTEEDIRYHAKRHAKLGDTGFFTKDQIRSFMSACGVKLPSEFSRLPYWEECMDYIIDLMHLIKNLGEHVCDSLIGADFDDKVRQWAKQEGIKANWWATGMHAPMRTEQEYLSGANAPDMNPSGVQCAYIRTTHVSSKPVV